MTDVASDVTLSPNHLVSGSRWTVVDLRADWPSIAQAPAHNPSDGATPANLAYVIYTSGSTGQPKGAMNTHRAIVNRLRWMQDAYHLATDDRVLQKTPISFDVSVWELFWPLISGAQLILARPGGHQDSTYLVDLIARQQMTTLHFVPSMLRLFLEEPDLARCSNLRRVICSGEALTRELHDRFFARLPAALHNLYGPTEVAVDVTAWACTPSSPRLQVPIGSPIANIQLYLLDAYLQPVPIGIPGELYIGGAGLARGYLNRTDLTAERFIPNSFAEVSGARYRVSEDAAPNTRHPIPDTRLYKTGDLARYQPDGTIEFLGRIDHQVKIRGSRVELGEIESVLLAQPLVRDAVVLVRAEQPDDQRLIAYIVPSATLNVAELTALTEALRIALAQQLPDYMIPSAFVLLQALPLTLNGKLDRRALPAPERPAQAAGWVAPRDWLEVQLVQLWEDLLDVRPISVKAPFFALGGHSLLAVRLMARLRELRGVALPLATLFRHPTIEQLAQLLREQATPAAPSALVGITTSGTKRPLFCIHPLGGNVLCYAALARRLGPDQPLYGVQAPGLEHEEALPATVEGMAAEYVEAIRALQPTGSYLLCGWSVGGVIALEIAQQLRAVGQEVALLALLDSYVPQPLAGRLPSERQLLVGMAQQLGLTLDPAALQPLEAEGQLAYVLAQAQGSDVMLPGLELGQFERLFSVYKANALALLCYTPRPYDRQVTLFQAQEVPQGSDPTFGWGALALGSVGLCKVPGDHGTMLQEPHVRVLAERLTEAITQAHLLSEAISTD